MESSEEVEPLLAWHSLAAHPSCKTQEICEWYLLSKEHLYLALLVCTLSAQKMLANLL
jgi:hypothetical protein